MRQGDIWLVEQPDRKSRPALVVTRSEALAVLSDVVVAPITSRLRQIPTCVPVGPGDGVDHDSVAVFDQLRCIPKSALTTRIGQLAPGRRHEICSAIAAMSDC